MTTRQFILVLTARPHYDSLHICVILHWAVSQDACSSGVAGRCESTRWLLYNPSCLHPSHSPSVGCDGSSCHESWKPVRTELCLLWSTPQEKEWSWPGQPVTFPHHACATEACQEPVDRIQNDSISDLCLHLEDLPIVPNMLVKWYLFHVISVLLFGHQNIFIHWEWENGKCSLFTIQHGRLGDNVQRIWVLLDYLATEYTTMIQYVTRHHNNIIENK